MRRSQVRFLSAPPDFSARFPATFPKPASGQLTDAVKATGRIGCADILVIENIRRGGIGLHRAPIYQVRGGVDDLAQIRFAIDAELNRPPNSHLSLSKAGGKIGAGSAEICAWLTMFSRGAAGLIANHGFRLSGRFCRSSPFLCGGGADCGRFGAGLGGGWATAAGLVDGWG